MYISLVITTRGDRPELQSALDSTKEVDEVIIVTDKPRLEHITRLNEGVKKAKGVVIMTMTDMTIMKPGWRQALENAFTTINNSGVVTFDETFCGTAAMSRDWYEEFNYFYHPDYIHYHGDQELGEVARKVNRYKEIRGDFKSMTPKRDLNQSQEHVAYDKDTYHKRTAAGYPKERIRTDEEREEALRNSI
jgi:hypothetical protein